MFVYIYTMNTNQQTIMNTMNNFNSPQLDAAAFRERNAIEQDIRTLLRQSADLMLTDFNIRTDTTDRHREHIAEIRLGEISTRDALAIQYEFIHAFGLKNVSNWVIDGMVAFDVTIQFRLES